MGTWIEIGFEVQELNDKLVVPYVGTWIEMSRMEYSLLMLIRRSLRGNVDRNKPALNDITIITVVPYVGTWIEIRYIFSG